MPAIDLELSGSRGHRCRHLVSSTLLAACAWWRSRCLFAKSKMLGLLGFTDQSDGGDVPERESL